MSGTINITSGGGADRLRWKGAWVTATIYAKNDQVANLGDLFVCILGHTAGATSEPGVGVSTATYWVKSVDMLTADQMAACVGTGTPASGNKFVTADWLTAARVTAGTFPAGAFAFTDPPALFRYGNACIVQAATDLLTVSEVSNTLINNYGQTVANTQTLPAAAIGMGFTAIIGTAGAGAFHIKAGASDLIYLDGLALHDGDKVSLTTPLVGNCICFWTFQTGVAAYDWFASVISGLWIDGGA
jgi:hypothetical protein